MWIALKNSWIKVVFFIKIYKKLFLLMIDLQNNIDIFTTRFVLGYTHLYRRFMHNSILLSSETGKRRKIKPNEKWRAR